MKGARTERIAEEIRKQVSQLVHFELGDPRLEGVTVTGVKMTPDLRVARVYFMIPGKPERQSKALSAFRASSGIIKNTLAKNVSLKFIPQLEYFYDESLELQERIDDLFDQLEKEKK